MNGWHKGKEDENKKKNIRHMIHMKMWNVHMESCKEKEKTGNTNIFEEIWQKFYRTEKCQETLESRYSEALES